MLRIVFMGTPDFSVPTLAAIADAGELAVPLIERQPHLEDDLRFGRGRDDARDAAERREVTQDVRRSCRRERSRGDSFDGGNRRARALLLPGQGCFHRTSPVWQSCPVTSSSLTEMICRRPASVASTGEA